MPNACSPWAHNPWAQPTCTPTNTNIFHKQPTYYDNICQGDVVEYYHRPGALAIGSTRPFDTCLYTPLQTCKVLSRLRRDPAATVLLLSILPHSTSDQQRHTTILHPCHTWHISHQ